MACTANSCKKGYGKTISVGSLVLIAAFLLVITLDKFGFTVRFAGATLALTVIGGLALMFTIGFNNKNEGKHNE